MTWPNSEMHEEMSVKTRTGSSAYGPVYGEPVAVACYVEPGFRRITDSSGAEVVASAMAICPSTATIAPGDEVTYDGRRYEVIDVQALRPNGSTHHLEVYLGSAA